jgi:hypothetical protein
LAISYLVQLTAGHHLAVQAATLALPSPTFQTLFHSLPIIICLLLGPRLASVALALAAIHLTASTTAMAAMPRQFHLLDHDGLSRWLAALFLVVLGLLTGLPLLFCQSNCDTFSSHMCSEALTVCPSDTADSGVCFVETLTLLGPVAVLAVNLALLVVILVKNSSKKEYTFVCRKASSFVMYPPDPSHEIDSSDNSKENIKQDQTISVVCSENNSLDNGYSSLDSPQSVPDISGENKWTIIKKRLRMRTLMKPIAEGWQNQVVPAIVLQESELVCTESYCPIPRELLGSDQSNSGGAGKELVVSPNNLVVEHWRSLKRQQSVVIGLPEKQSYTADGNREVNDDLDQSLSLSLTEKDGHNEEGSVLAERQISENTCNGWGADKQSTQDRFAAESQRSESVEQQVNQKRSGMGLLSLVNQRSNGAEQGIEGSKEDEIVDEIRPIKTRMRKNGPVSPSPSFQSQPFLHPLPAPANAPSTCRRVAVRPAENELTWIALITGFILFGIFLLALCSLLLERVAVQWEEPKFWWVWSVLRVSLGLRYRCLYLLPWAWYCRHAELRHYAVRKIRCWLGKPCIATHRRAGTAASIIDA